MSGRPVTGDGALLPPAAPSNPNGVPSLGCSALNPTKTDMNPTPHMPTVTVPHFPVPTTTSMVNPSSQQQQPTSNETSKIPPLMGMRPNVSSLPPPPPAQLPPPPPTAQFPTAAVPKATLPIPHPVAPLQSGSPAGQSGPVNSPIKDPPQPNTSVATTGKAPSSGAGGNGPGKQMKGGDSEEDGGGAHPKLPILRLKKTLGGGEEDGFEKQDASKNDSYCWVCHDGGDVLCCDKCPRVFHLQCSGLQKPPDDEDNEWFCSICKNIARKTKRSRPPHLKELLLLAVERMMFPGTEIFQAPVPPDIMTHYREYIFFPLHLGKIKEKVKMGKYQSTREFTHDTEWILHNCIIYNGAKHALTKIAKNIVKVCKEDMREIELCPGCYRLTVNQPKDWFCIPCNPPHPVVLAKVRGYPLWPAKLISETSDKCDVRFFGQHDRSLVPKCDIQVLNGLPPKPSTKTKHWNQAMFELKKYGENIEAMRDNLGGVKDKSLKMLMKNKIGKPSVHVGGASQEGGKQKDSSGGGGTRPMSNHTAPVVEVTPSDGVDGAGSDIEVSSPGTPPSLQIDLRDSSSGGGVAGMEKSPSKGRALPSGGRGLIPNRNSQVPVSLDFNSDSAAQSVVVRSPGGGSKMGKKKGYKAGAALQALVSSLAQRKRVAEQVGGSTGMMPVHQGASISAGGSIGGVGNVAGQDESESAKVAAGEPQVKNDSPFSSIYEYEKKTGFAIVDPNQKRTKRKTPKAASNEGPPSKKARVANTGGDSSSAAAASGKAAESDPMTLSDPAALAAKVQEFGNAAIHALSSTASSTATPQNVASLKVSTANVRASMSTSPQNTSGSSNHSAAPAPPPALPSIPKARATGKKKAGKKGDRRAGKSPYKGKASTAAATAAAAAAAASMSSSATNQQTSGVSSSLAALISAPVNTSSANVSAAASTTAPVPSTSESSAISRAEFLAQVSQGATTSGHTGPSTSSSSAEIRGEAAAPGITSEGISSFAEGTGLLADTIRKVDASFMARVNQITGPTDDMGYKYFVEKLMASIKTVLIEMLSTFDAKSRTSTKQLKEQLHQGWPVSNSAVAIEQLGKELRDEMKQSLEVVRASAALELQQVVNEVRRHVEKEKEIAIIETKKKKWCTYCLKPAIFNCCWNANYCTETCQQEHWPEHMEQCTQIHNSLGRATTPMQKGPAAGQLSPTLGVGGVPNGVGLQGQDTQASAFLFPLAQTQAQSQAPPTQSYAAQGQPGAGGDLTAQQAAGRMSPVVSFVNHTSMQQQQQPAMPTLSGLPPPPPVHPSQQHLRAAAGSSNTGIRHDQHHVTAQGSSLLHVDGMHQMDTLPGPSQLTAPSQHMEKTVGGHMELANDRGAGLITPANTASPPNHIRNMLLSQHHQQSSKGTVITGSNPMLMSHPSPGPPPPAGPPSHTAAVHTPPSHGNVHTPPMGAADMHPGLSSRSMSSEHSHSSNSSGMLHPMSPVTPPTDANNPQPSAGAHSYAGHGWSYPHPQLLLGNESSYSHGLPLMPTMQANTPTTQNHAFFKATF